MKKEALAVNSGNVARPTGLSELDHVVRFTFANLHDPSNQAGGQRRFFFSMNGCDQDDFILFMKGRKRRNELSRRSKHSGVIGLTPKPPPGDDGLSSRHNRYHKWLRM